MKSPLPRIALRPAGLALAALTLLLAGCGPVKLVAVDTIPPPLIVKIPVQVALRVPPEFASYVHEEERAGTNWHVEVGKAQSDGITRLLQAMFEQVIAVDSVSAGANLSGAVQAILEPALDEFTFVTPRDAGTPYYAVSLKYRMNIYLTDGTPADSWTFTGYGSAPSAGLSSNEPLAHATAAAMRDAGAKLAVEFRDQAVLRGLIPAAPGAAVPAETEAPAASPPPAQSESESASESDSDSDSESAPEAPTEVETALPGSAAVSPQS